MVEKSTIETVRRFVEALVNQGIGIEKVVLYGSRVRGRATPESDIDVAIVSRDFGKDPVEEGMFLFRIAGGIDPKIEPVPISLKSFNEDTWVPLIYEIKTMGIEIDIQK